MGGDHDWNLYFTTVKYRTSDGKQHLWTLRRYASGVRQAASDARLTVKSDVKDLEKILSVTVR